MSDTQAPAGVAPNTPQRQQNGRQISLDNPRPAPHAIPLRAHNMMADEGIDGPWAKKTVASFDGGGVRGYSSLLVLKHLASFDGGGVRGYSSLLVLKHLASFDGGGVRGYSSLLVLKHLMTEIEKVELELDMRATSSCFYEWRGEGTEEHQAPPDMQGVYLPCHYFDFIAGTSTGGLAAIMLGRLRLSVDEALQQYAEFGNEVFGKARWWHERSILWYPRAKYPTRKVRGAYQRIIYHCLKKEHPDIGPDRAVREQFKYREDRTRTMVFSFLIDKDEGISRPYLWRTYDNLYGTRTLNGSEAHTEEIWKVARATSAAPRFFESIKIGGWGDRKKHLDGGMCANNPSIKTYWEVRKLTGQVPAFFLSIGTGKKPEGSHPAPRVRLRDFDRVARADDVRRKQFLKKYLEIGNRWKDFMTDTEGDNGFQGWKDIAESHNMPHERFNVEGDMACIPLDDWRPIGSGEATLEKMRVATEEYLAQKDVARKIEETARLLVQIRRERARTERWETFATDATYVCPSSHECRAVPRYSNRREFREHVLNNAFHNTAHADLKNDVDALEDFLNTGRRYGKEHVGNLSRAGTTQHGS